MARLCSIGVQALTIAALKRLERTGETSVETLARALAVPPAEIERCLVEARAAGVSLKVSPDGRVALAAPLDWLDAEAIARALAGTGLHLAVVDCCRSTNSELLDAMRIRPESGRGLAAEMQTAGRGRSGRPWYASLCRSLAFSLSWRFDLPLAALSGLSLAAGVAIVRALRARAVEAELKWPNDVLWLERKLGGILVETRGGTRSPALAVIGVGINVRLQAEERVRIDQPVCDLHEAGGDRLSRSAWLAVLLEELARVLRTFERNGFEPLRDEWQRYHAHADREVDLALPGGERLRGVARGIDASGRLLLAAQGGVRAVAGGEVSLRARP